MENDLRYFEYPYKKPPTFHCFNISKHISISVLFFIILSHVLCSFCWIYENKIARGGILARFFAPGVGVSQFLCTWGLGIHTFKNIPWGCCPGEGDQVWN